MPFMPIGLARSAERLPAHPDMRHTASVRCQAVTFTHPGPLSPHGLDLAALGSCFPSLTGAGGYASGRWPSFSTLRSFEAVCFSDRRSFSKASASSRRCAA